MGEAFRAEIDLLSYTGAATLTPRLASPEIYPPRGLPYNPALTGARLNIQTRANGRHVIEVVSVRPLNEPFVYLLVELESDATRIVRGYTALLDPPGYHAPQAAVVEYLPVLIPVAAPAVKPAAVRAPVLDRSPAAARPASRPEVLSNTDAKTLAAMLERVVALEAAVAQLQRQWEKPAVAVVAPPPAAPPKAAPPPAAQPVVVQAAPVAAPPAAPVVQTKPAAPVEPVPRRTSKEDSLLNNALLVLAIGLLILLGGLVYVMWGRQAKERPAKGD